MTKRTVKPTEGYDYSKVPRVITCCICGSMQRVTKSVLLCTVCGYPIERTLMTKGYAIDRL